MVRFFSLKTLKKGVSDEGSEVWCGGVSVGCGSGSVPASEFQDVGLRDCSEGRRHSPDSVQHKDETRRASVRI